MSDDLVVSAERLLAAAWGSPVRLTATDVLREKYRNQVRRLRVESAPPNAPATVIVKASVPPEGESFDLENDDMGGATWRFFNEWAGTAFLNSLAADPPICARLYGGDQGMIVLEDLGTPLSLANRMEANDRAALENALQTYARSIGRLHAKTVGREAEFTGIRRSLGGREETREPEGIRWLRENVEPLTKLCDSLGVVVPPGFEAEVEVVRQTLDTAGPFWAFTPGDTCPDNHRLPEDGGRYLRFFDFEFAGFRHCLLDAAYLLMPFPTCWCVNRLPHDLAVTLLTIYREEVADSIPAATSPTFGRELVGSAAYWLIATLSWGWENALKEDSKWGLSSVRQRHLMRLENFRWAELEFAPGAFPALTELSRRLLETLRTRWKPNFEEMPLYAALRPEVS